MGEDDLYPVLHISVSGTCTLTGYKINACQTNFAFIASDGDILIDSVSPTTAILNCEATSSTAMNYDGIIACGNCTIKSYVNVTLCLQGLKGNYHVNGINATKVLAQTACRLNVTVNPTRTRIRSGTKIVYIEPDFALYGINCPLEIVDNTNGYVSVDTSGVNENETNYCINALSGTSITDNGRCFGLYLKNNKDLDFTTGEIKKNYTLNRVSMEFTGETYKYYSNVYSESGTCKPIDISKLLDTFTYPKVGDTYDESTALKPVLSTDAGCYYHYTVSEYLSAEKTQAVSEIVKNKKYMITFYIDAPAPGYYFYSSSFTTKKITPKYTADVFTANAATKSISLVYNYSAPEITAQPQKYLCGVQHSNDMDDTVVSVTASGNGLSYAWSLKEGIDGGIVSADSIYESDITGLDTNSISFDYNAIIDDSEHSSNAYEFEFLEMSCKVTSALTGLSTTSDSCYVYPSHVRIYSATSNGDTKHIFKCADTSCNQELDTKDHVDNVTRDDENVVTASVPDGKCDVCGQTGLVLITKQPKNASVVCGKNGTFTVTATGDNLKYQWYKNGEKISGATSSKLTLKSVKCSDTGAEYYCVVSNSYNSITTDKVKLTVSNAEASYKTTEKKHTQQCSSCGKTLGSAENHKAGNAVKENTVKATYTAGGSYDSVVYCSVCGFEMSRDKVLTPKLEKTTETTTAKAKDNAETTTAKAKDNIETTTAKAKDNIETTTAKDVVESEFSFGDINHDGKIRANDARLVLRDSADLDVYAGKTMTEIAEGVFQTEDGKIYNRNLADINHDGKIRASDARKILRASAELEDPTTW